MAWFQGKQICENCFSSTLKGSKRKKISETGNVIPCENGKKSTKYIPLLLWYYVPPFEQAAGVSLFSHRN